MTVRIEPVDVHSASEATLRGMYEATIDRDADFYPDDPVPSFEYHTNAWLAPGGVHRKEQHWAAFDDSSIVGAARAITWVDHEDSGLVVVAVRKPNRRQQVGSQLLQHCLDGLEAQGRSKLIIDAPVGSPVEPELEHLGLKKALAERLSRLALADVDWELMDQWIQKAHERAVEYDLLFMNAPLPEQHLDNWCRISDVMNSAPHEDLELEDAEMTPEKWRSIERNCEARGLALRAGAAVHRQTGEFAGLSVLMFQEHMRWLGIQDDTGVDPDHRNKGLGRLLKASMVKRFSSEFPEVEMIETGNAGTNEPMLNINIEMGFKPALFVNAWQGDIATARDALALS